MSLTLLAALIALQSPPVPEIAKPGEIVVEGHVLTRAEANHIVHAVGRPESTGGFEVQYARWQERICVTVAGFPRENGQYIADDIGRVAQTVGLEAGGPGCQPNIVIVATTAPARLIAAMRTHRAGLTSGQTNAILNRIQRSHDAVRWIGAIRFTNRDGQDSSPSGIANGNNGVPTFDIFGAASRLQATTRTYLDRMTVVVDINQIDGLNYQQLADYLAFVTLAQVNPNGSGIEPDSILSLFPRGKAAPATLTNFDRAYLAGLYRSNPSGTGAIQRAAITDALRRGAGAAHPADTPSSAKDTGR
jgi:hypothetical protein